MAGEARVRSLGREVGPGILEWEMATHSSILAWKILWTEGPSWLLSIRSQRVEHSRAAEHAQSVVASRC